MNTSKILVGCYVFVVLIITKGFAQETAQAPQYKDGECWQFRHTERDFIGSNSRILPVGEYEICYSIKNNRMTAYALPNRELASSLGDTSILMRMLNRQQQTLEFLKFPLAAGQKWETEYNSPVRGTTKPVKRRAETSVTGIEEISPPAGKFKTFKIERVVYIIGRPKATDKFTYFYSPETRSIVKLRLDFLNEPGTREIELTKWSKSQK